MKDESKPGKKSENKEKKQDTKPRRNAVKAVWILSLLIVLILVGGYMYLRTIKAEHERDMLEQKQEQGQNQPKVQIMECRMRLESCQKDLGKCERMLSGYQDNQ
ncbi:MAG: hypothetical protein R6V85_02790 [Polyangia bacterium]